MNFASSPAFRPSHPHGCRKRSSGQGHALSGRFAGLDRMPLLSGYGRLRATDEEASGGGSVKGSSHTSKAAHTFQESCADVLCSGRIKNSGTQDTGQQQQTLPAACSWNTAPEKGPSMPGACLWHRRILTSRKTDSDPSAAESGSVIGVIPIRQTLPVIMSRATCNPVMRHMRSRYYPDADPSPCCSSAHVCVFVRRYFRGPAYVSYRRFASYFTAGEGRCPFEPRKGKRQARR